MLGLASGEVLDCGDTRCGENAVTLALMTSPADTERSEKGTE